jgi:hypothetical protein
VLRLLAAGLANRRIAQNLGISGHTAFHVIRILGKLDAAARAEAVAIGPRDRADQRLKFRPSARPYDRRRRSRAMPVRASRHRPRARR